MSASSILIEAQRLLRDVGVCKGILYWKGEDGSVMAYCSFGALTATYNPYKDNNEIHQANNFLREVIGGHGCISFWNDDPKRTRNEILAAFAEAIALAKQEEEKEANNG